MSRPFDMELFLAAVLTGSYATRQRHLRQVSSKLRYLNTGSWKYLGLGRGSMWLSF